MQHPDYTGSLRRGNTESQVEGELVDQFGWRIRITGFKNPAGPGYILRGVVVSHGRLAIEGDEGVTDP
jgi:hypothetical protein